MLQQYQQILEAKAAQFQAEKEAEFQAKAEKMRGIILNRIWDTVPIFYNTYEHQLQDCESAWFNCSKTSSKYGMPGIVVWGHLFIGLKRDSDCNRLYLGSWKNQEAYTNDFHVENGIPCMAPIELDKVDSFRLSIEQKFLDQIKQCIHLIEANPDSYTNWRFER